MTPPTRKVPVSEHLEPLDEAGRAKERHRVALRESLDEQVRGVAQRYAGKAGERRLLAEAQAFAESRARATPADVFDEAYDRADPPTPQEERASVVLDYLSSKVLAPLAPSTSGYTTISDRSEQAAAIAQQFSVARPGYARSVEKMYARNDYQLTGELPTPAPGAQVSTVTGLSAYQRAARRMEGLTTEADQARGPELG